jgi:hypothetical protein
MLKDKLEEIRNEVLKKRREKDEQESQERLKKVSEKYSKIIEDLIVELTDAANKGYNSCCLIGPENFYMLDEDELRYWSRSEKINLNFKRDIPYITHYNDRSKIKVIEIFASF